jgi:hypothetical protein
MVLQNTKMIQRICTILSIGYCIVQLDDMKYNLGMKVVPDTSFGTWLKISFVPLSSSSYLLLSGPGSRPQSYVLVGPDGWF